jgi:hypothetical protein
LQREWQKRKIALEAKRQNGGPHWFFDNFQKNKILIKLKNARHFRGSKIQRANLSSNKRKGAERRN